MMLLRQWANRILLIAVSSLVLLVSSAYAENLNPLVRLSETEVSDRLQQLPDWTVRDQQLVCTYQLGSFVEAIAFVNRLVDPAEAAEHHPDLLISYNRVTVTLTTHDAGGLTALDFALAEAIAQLHNEIHSSTPGCQPN
ncbi:4a-hydroxytetrahydrobiopterin dehydratase [Leptolyngbya sp. FACHB-541]|uniref:4a-hydroxytetrahydrobiopterin dehydratase n=1 Tax=Leptolyngbya sp. FACHB-541 TaxID=2692810 RepID=UPI001F549410